MKIAGVLVNLMNMMLLAMNSQEQGRILSDVNPSKNAELTSDEARIFDLVTSQYPDAKQSISVQIIERMDSTTDKEVVDFAAASPDGLVKQLLREKTFVRQKKAKYKVNKTHKSRGLVDSQNTDENITSTFVSDKKEMFGVFTESKIEGDYPIYHGMFWRNVMEKDPISGEVIAKQYHSQILSYSINNKLYDTVTTYYSGNQDADNRTQSNYTQPHVAANEEEISRLFGRRLSVEHTVEAQTQFVKKELSKRRNLQSAATEPFINAAGIPEYNHFAGFTPAAAARFGGAANLNAVMNSYHAMYEANLELQVGHPVIDVKLVGTRIYSNAKIDGAFTAFNFAKSAGFNAPANAHWGSMFFDFSEIPTSGIQQGVGGVGGAFIHFVSSVPEFITWAHEIGHENGATHEEGYCDPATGLCTLMKYTSPTPFYSQDGLKLYGIALGDKDHQNMATVLQFIYLRANKDSNKFETLAPFSPAVKTKHPSLRPTTLRPTSKGVTKAPTFNQTPTLNGNDFVKFIFTPPDNTRYFKLKIGNRMITINPVTNEVTLPGSESIFGGNLVVVDLVNNAVMQDSRQSMIYSISYNNLLKKLKQNVPVTFRVKDSATKISVTCFIDGVEQTFFDLMKKSGSTIYMADPVIINAMVPNVKFLAINDATVTLPVSTPVTLKPTMMPTKAAATARPTLRQNVAPTIKYTKSPTKHKTTNPTTQPSLLPTIKPSKAPTKKRKR